METLFLLIPLSLIALAIAVIFFFRMNATGQFDDDQGPAWSVVLDDDRAIESASDEHGSMSGNSAYNPPKRHTDGQSTAEK